MGSPLNQQVGDDSSLAATIQFALRQHSLMTENCLPAIVVSYDSKTNLAVIKPIVMMTLKDAEGTQSTRARQEIPDVPVLSLGAGNFHMHFPLSAGDLGWLIASDRDIGAFMKNLTEAAAPTQRFHSLADGVFIPDVFRKYTLNPEDEDAMVMQSTDGNTRISIRADNIKVTTPLNVVIDTPATRITGTLTVDGAVTHNDTVTTQGRTNMNSGFDSTGGGGSSCDALSVNGVDVGGHTHTDPQGGSVGPMQ